MSPTGSLSNSSECLTALDDSDSIGSMSLLPVHDTIIKAAINKSSPLQLTNQAPREPIMSLKDYLHALDRHKSIDNCFLSHPSDDRLCLLEFDEIKKITNHLFDIVKQKPEPQTNGTTVDMNEHQTTNNRVHDMNIQNLNPMQTTAVDNASESNTFKESDGVDVKNVKTLVTSHDEGLVDVNNNKINDTDGNSSRSHPFAEIFRKFSSLAESHVTDATNAPWPVTTKRTKFRINQMSSRDVPIFRTEKPAKLQKQNAIDACDTKLFDERINHKSLFSSPSPLGKNCIVDLLESFERDRNEMLQSHFRHKTFIDRIPNGGGSISFDCGQLDVEQRSINTIRSLFQLHATTGRNVKQIQARIEAKNKWIRSEA